MFIADQYNHLFSAHFSLRLFLSYAHIDQLTRLFHSLVLQQSGTGAAVVVNVGLSRLAEFGSPPEDFMLGRNRVC